MLYFSRLLTVRRNRMAVLKKILPYLLTSLAVIGLWRLFTLTENYAWSPKGKERLMLDIALTTIFLYKAAFWLIIANLLVFILKSIFKNRYKVAGIASFAGVAFYFFAGQVVDKNCAFSYYMVFVNQSVSEEYLQDPIREAGYHIGPIITDNIKDRQMELRRYAISGLGDINYKPATETLQQILLDRTEPDFIRADAYVVLTRFNSPTSKRVLSYFILSAKDTADTKVMKLGNNFLNPN
jgi:hypothetical protein